VLQSGQAVEPSGFGKVAGLPGSLQQFTRIFRSFPWPCDLGRSADVARMRSASLIDRILAEKFARKKGGRAASRRPKSREETPKRAAAAGELPRILFRK
jgi:hypothetical protein